MTATHVDGTAAMTTLQRLRFAGLVGAAACWVAIAHVTITLPKTTGALDRERGEMLAEEQGPPFPDDVRGYAEGFAPPR